MELSLKTRASPKLARGLRLWLRMLPRIFLALSLIQLIFIYVPMPVWGLWMVHYGALEACFLASVTGSVALWMANERWMQGLALLGILGGLLPGLLIAPLYWREGASFSPWSWLTGGSVPEVTIERDLKLLPGLSADLYRAPGAGPHPFVVVVHGGSWRSGSKGEVPATSRFLAAAGFSVMDVDYRLSGTARFPAAISDVKCWLAAIRRNAETLGIDPDRGALLGRSAGGQIVLVSAYSDATIGPACEGTPATIKAVLSIYGPTDLAWAYDHPLVPDVVKGPEAEEAYLGGPPGAVPGDYELATPQSWVRRAQTALPPTLLIHGTAERCVRPRNAEVLAAELEAHQQKVKLLLVPQADHGFDVRRGGLGEQLSRASILQFLKEKL